MTRIALFSDSHDNLAALRKALNAARASEATTLIHCGDLSAPFMVRELGKGFNGAIHIVFGNNDADGRMFQVVASQYPQIKLHGIYGEIQVEGHDIAFIHYPEPARRIAQSEVFALVAHGHNHTKSIERVGETWLVNPGELMGMEGTPTWALYDTDTDTVEWREVQP